MSESQQSKYTVPSDCWAGTMRGIYYNNLPHWVVDHGCYALTFHCVESLPKEVLVRFSELIELNKGREMTDTERLRESRTRFKILEFYLDQNMGAQPFGASAIREQLNNFLANCSDGLRFRHWVIMPNHIHLLTEPLYMTSAEAFQKAIKIFKMRSTHFVNQHSDRSGKLWMRGGYDRWIRDAAEYTRWIDYLRNNPVKAHLCNKPDSWIGLR